MEVDAVPQKPQDISKAPLNRLAIFTKDQSVLQGDSLSYKRFLNLANVFAEVHIVVLMTTDQTESLSIVRPAKNVWFYPVVSETWWKSPFDAFHSAEQQLVFSGELHADIIVAEDPHEAGLSAWMLAKKYQKPLQLHVHADVFDEAYLEGTNHKTLYAWVQNYLFKRVTSVQTQTDFQKQVLEEEFPNLKDAISILPSHYDLEAWRDAVPSFSVKEKYPRFKFVILHITNMQKASHSKEVIIGSAKMLHRYPTLGLVIVGSGPLRTELEKTALTLGVHEQVEFESTSSEFVSYLKSAHVLVHLSDDGAEDEVVLASACVRIPIVANKNGVAGRLFVDGDSALLCDPTDTECVTDGINRYLNENMERNTFSHKAYDAVFAHITQDYDTYLEDYKKSIERCMVT